MEWLFIVGLGVALVLQHNRINRLARELDALRPAETAPAQPAPATIVAAAAARTAAPSDEERLAAAQAALAAARRWRAPAAPPVTPPPVKPPEPPKPAEPTPAPVALKAPPPQTTAPPAPAKPPPAPETARAISAWLAENGLAWLGGGALALGGLLLVVYAAQRGVFTPPLRILAALALGAAMVAAGEWIRRQKHAPGGRHMLAAAAAAGAGATTIYGAIWAAHALYDLIPLPVAAALIAVECLLLLTYAFLHGQPLAMLALVGGFLAPAITGPRDWSPPALQTYLGLLIVTGFATAALRGWREAGIVAIAGGFFWALAAWAAVDHVQAILLTLGPVLAAGLALEARQRRPAWGEAAAAEVLPRIALAAASVLALFAWLRVFSESGDVWLPAPALAGGLLIAAAALLAARRLAPAEAFLPPAATAILGAAFALYLTGPSLWTAPGFTGESQRDVAALMALALAAMTAACGLAAALLSQDRSRTVLAGAGGLGAALLATLAWPAFNALGYAHDAAAPGALAAAMALGAWALARRSPEPPRDAALGLWIAGAAELLYLCVYGALVPFWAPAGQAAAAVLLALIALRLPWRGLAAAAAAGGLVAFASLLRFDVVELAISPDTAAWRTALAAGAAAALAFLAGRVLRRSEGRRNEAEALETAALLIALLGGFLLIHRAFLGEQAATLGPLMAASLRTLLILAAALLLAWRAREDDGWLARWRLPVLLVAGLGYGAIAQGLAFNPWWGGGEAPLGPPLANSLTLAYLAPALLLAAIAWRGIGAGAGWSRTAAAGAFGFGWLWALMAIRDLFHPNGMDSGPTGHAEWAAYALLALAGALALKVAHERGRGGERLAWLAVAAQPAAWAALGFAVLTFWLAANPWWGPNRFSMPLPVAALLLALYAAGAGAMAALAWRARAPESWRPLAQATETALAAQLFLLAVLAVRCAFHGGRMGVWEVGRAETAAYALVALAFAWTLARLRHRPGWLAEAAQPAGWIAMLYAAVALWVAASPWWGPDRAPLAPAAGAALLFALYAAGAGLRLEIARRADAAGWRPLARTALGAAVVDLFVWVTLLVRYAFRGEAMAVRVAEARVETWAFSAVWALFGLAVLVIGAARRSLTLRWLGLAILIGTVLKVLIFDTARLDGVIRAASFLAVGALLIVGAVAARRLNAGAFFAPRRAAAEPEPPA